MNRSIKWDWAQIINMLKLRLNCSNSIIISENNSCTYFIYLLIELRINQIVFFLMNQRIKTKKWVANNFNEKITKNYRFRYGRFSTSESQIMCRLSTFYWHFSFCLWSRISTTNFPSSLMCTCLYIFGYWLSF